MRPASTQRAVSSRRAGRVVVADQETRQENCIRVALIGKLA
jgi:hypothetical protein